MSRLRFYQILNNYNYNYLDQFSTETDAYIGTIVLIIFF